MSKKKNDDKFDVKFWIIWIKLDILDHLPTLVSNKKKSPRQRTVWVAPCLSTVSLLLGSAIAVVRHRGRFEKISSENPKISQFLGSIDRKK